MRIILFNYMKRSRMNDLIPEKYYSKMITLLCMECRVKIRTHLKNSSAKCPKCGKEYSSVKIADIIDCMKP